MLINAGFNTDPSKLTTNDLGTVLEELVDVSAQWYPLGLQLNIDVGTLDVIKAQYSDPQEQLRGMLRSWLRSICDCSWKNLVGALRSRSVGENVLGYHLERKYCMSWGKREKKQVIVQLLPTGNLRLLQLLTSLTEHKARE